MDQTRHHDTDHYEISDPVLRFVQASVVEAPPTGRVDEAVPKVPQIPVIECRLVDRVMNRHETTHQSPMVCQFVRGGEAPLGTYMNQETGSIVSCTGTNHNFLCQLRPTYELAHLVPGGFVVSLSDRGPTIQNVDITQASAAIPLFMMRS